MSGTDSRGSTERRSSIAPLFWGVLVALVAFLVTYFTTVRFHRFVQTSPSWAGTIGAILVFWVLFLFAVAFIGAAAGDRTSGPYSRYPKAWVWAGYGVLGAIAALGVGILGSWLDVDAAEWGATLALARTPVVSLLILSLTGSVGYVYTTLDDSEDNDGGVSPEEHSQTQSDQSDPSDEQQDAEESLSQDSGATPELQFDWQRETDVSMRDVGGMEELKQQLHQEIVRPLTTDQDRAAALDISTPNLLLYGPPGTGKTFIAKALATELGLPFVSLSGADVTSKWINESSQKINRLFREARDLSKTEGGAVIFLDEIDAVLPERTGSAHEETRKVVNEFLAQLQDTSEYDIVFIGATNRRESLDDAAMRNGRIDREIELTYPDIEGRIKILHTQLQKRNHDLSEDHLFELGEQTQGYSAADLKTLVEDASRHAAFERDADRISMVDFHDVM